jgi:hypothetical protein
VVKLSERLRIVHGGRRPTPHFLARIDLAQRAARLVHAAAKGAWR